MLINIYNNVKNPTKLITKNSGPFVLLRAFLKYNVCESL